MHVLIPAAYRRAVDTRRGLERCRRDEEVRKAEEQPPHLAGGRWSLEREEENAAQAAMGNRRTAAEDGRRGSGRGRNPGYHVNFHGTPRLGELWCAETSLLFRQWHMTYTIDFRWLVVLTEYAAFRR